MEKFETKNQKSMRWEEKSGIRLELDGEGQGKEKPPIRTTLLWPRRLGRSPAVSFARAAVYSTNSSAMITTEIMVDDTGKVDGESGEEGFRRSLWNLEKKWVFSNFESCLGRILVVMICERESKVVFIYEFVTRTHVFFFLTKK